MDGAAKQGDIGGAIDVATTGKPVLLLTVSAAVGIVAHVGTFVDDDVGVVLIGLPGAVVYLCPPHNRVFQVGRQVADIVECRRKV